MTLAGAPRWPDDAAAAPPRAPFRPELAPPAAPLRAALEPPLGTPDGGGPTPGSMGGGEAMAPPEEIRTNGVFFVVVYVIH